MLDPIVWNQNVHPYKNGFGINKYTNVDMPKTPNKRIYKANQT